MARHLDICDAVVTALNDHEFSQAFTAVRKYRPHLVREECSDVQVTVIPASYTTEPADRSRSRSQYGVEIAVQKEVDPDSNTACDAMLELVYEIRDFFAMQRLSGLQSAAWQKVEMVQGAEAGFAPQHLDELRLFTGVLRLTWQVIEA